MRQQLQYVFGYSRDILDSSSGAQNTWFRLDRNWFLPVPDPHVGPRIVFLPEVVPGTDGTGNTQSNTTLPETKKTVKPVKYPIMHRTGSYPVPKNTQFMQLYIVH